MKKMRTANGLFPCNGSLPIRSNYCAAHLVLAAAPFLFAGQTVPAINNQWFGAWKLNRALSHLTRPSITIVRIPHGYHFDFGAVEFDIGDDGKDYPTIAPRSTSLKAVGDREWLRVHKENGKEVDHSTLQIARDDRTLLIHTSAAATNGNTHRSDEILKRVGAGTGLAGTWRSTLTGIDTPKVIVLEDAGEGRIRRTYANEGQSYTVRPNGKAAAYEGPHSVPGVTVTLTNVSEAEMRWTEFVNGKPYSQGIDELSTAGKVLKETTWPVNRPADKQQAVYQK